MSVMSDSGQLPAVQIQVPILSVFPASSPSFALRQVSRQFLKESALAETNFGLPDHHQYSLTKATKEEWLLFCNQCHANTIGYTEGGAYPALSRRDFANTQMRSGCMILCYNPNAKTQLLLVPARIAILTCADLARQEQWCTALCCAECHAQQDFRRVFFASNNPFAGLKERRHAHVCCRCEKLLPEWYPGRVFGVHELRTHEICTLDDDDEECIDDDSTSRHV